jgi:biopolymer transport protein ExbB/TolQ
VFAGRFAMQLVLVIGAGGGILYLGFSLVFLRPLPDTFSGTYFALRNLSAFLAPFLVFSMLAYVLVVSLVIALLSGYAFHKIAGPLYRMERALENYDSGDAVKAVFLREGDKLVPLSRAYNRYVAVLRVDRQSWLAIMEDAERLCLQDAATCRAEMEKALARLSEQLSRYR